MTCRHAQSLIQAHQVGELDAKGAQALENHLLGCADCRREHEAQQRLTELVAQYHVPEPPADYYQSMQYAVLRQLRAQTSDRPHSVAWWQTFFLRPAFAASVAVAAAFVCGLFIGRAGARPAPSQPLMAHAPSTAPAPKASTQAAVHPNKSSLTDKARALVRVPASPKASAPQNRSADFQSARRRDIGATLKKSQKRSRPIHSASPVRNEAPPRSEQGMENRSDVSPYVVYSLEPPLLTLSTAADSAASSGTDTAVNDESAAGEVVAPVHQQLIVPLNAVNTNVSNTAQPQPQDKSGSSQEGQSVPVI